MDAVEPELDPRLVEECVGNAHGNLDRVRELVEAQPRLALARAPWNETPIEAASQMGRRDIVEYLVSRGAPVDFFTACVLGRVDQVEDELRSEPGRARGLGVHGLPALYFAGVGGQLEIAELLFRSGAEPNQGASAGAPIHGAVMGGRPELVRWMLAHGADPQTPDSQGRPARELALAMGRADLAELLG